MCLGIPNWVILVFLAVGGQFRPFETLRERLPFKPYIVSHFALPLPNFLDPPRAPPSPLPWRKGGEGESGREAGRVQHFPLFGRFSAERKRTPPPKP